MREMIKPGTEKKRRGRRVGTIAAGLFCAAGLAVATVFFLRHNETSQAREQMENAFVSLQPLGATVSTLSFREVGSYRAYTDNNYGALTKRYGMLKEMTVLAQSSLSEKYIKRRVAALLEKAGREVKEMQKMEKPDSESISVLKEKIRLLSQVARDDASMTEWALMIGVKTKKARLALEDIVYSPGYELVCLVRTPDGKETVVYSYAPRETPNRLFVL